MSTSTPPPYSLPSATRIGYVHLTVQNLDRQITFYTKVLGFNVHWREGSEAALGTEQEVLLHLSENPNALRMQQTTGMYHFAILYPSLKELARAIARLFVMRYPNAPTDHGMSKTTYLDDLEGNNIELYVRSLEDAVVEIVNGEMVVQYADGRVGSGRDPLNLEALFNELSDDDPLDSPLPDGTQIGHVHLYGTHIPQMFTFYRDTLGFQNWTHIENFQMGDVGLDEQQPHVVAFNTWKGISLPPAPDHALGLRYFTLTYPSSADLVQAITRLQDAGIETQQTPAGVQVYDPAHIQVILTDQMPSLSRR